MTILDIEEILYNGSKKQIEDTMKKFEITYKYGEKSKSLEIKSNKINQISRGYNSEKIPNCVKYFGNEYIN